MVDEDETEDEYPMNLSHGVAQKGSGDGGERDDDDNDDDGDDADMDMDIDLESEDGYGERRPLQEPSAPTTARTSEDGGSGRESQEPGSTTRVVNRKEATDSTTTTNNKKGKARPAKRAPVPKGKATKKKATKPKNAASTSTDSGPQNPYPLEGKYKDEDDRDYLLNLAEIEREEIIAARLEEHQQFVDRQQLAALYSRTNPGAAPIENEDDDDEDDDEHKGDGDVAAESEQEDMDLDVEDESEQELGRGATRVKAVSEPKSKALNKLAESRKARNERVNNRVRGAFASFYICL